MARIKVAELFVPVTSDTSDFERGMNNAKKIAQGFGKNVQTLGKLALGGLGLVGTGAAAAGGALLKLAADAAPLQQVESAFMGMAEAAGTSGDEVLRGMQQASGGMIAQRDLMLSFNKASQLVSKDFGTRLPEAMGSLQKVAASTGQDMNFLLDSLVTGVGRVSPMILDNLGIQVDLTAATEEYAESIGKTASELSKEEQQIALTNQVFEKLAANTADMPDTTGTAAAALAQLRAMFTDLKDEVGTAFLPVLLELANAALPLLKAAIPPIIEGVQSLTSTIQPILEALAHFTERITSGVDPMIAFKEAIFLLFPSDTARQVMGIVEQIRGFIAGVQEALSPILQFIANNVELKDILIALGIAIATVVVPILAPLVVGFLKISAVAAALVAGVAALRTAWENNFLGIRDVSQAVFGWIRDNVGPIWNGVKTVITTVVNTISTVVNGVLEAVRGFWERNGENITTLVNAYWGGVQRNIELFTGAIKAVVNTVLSAIEAFWDTHGATIEKVATTAWEGIQSVIDNVTAIIDGIIATFASAVEGDWEAFGENLRVVWDNLWEAVQTAMETAGTAIIQLVVGLVGDIIEKFKEIDWGQVGRDVIDGIAKGITGAAGKIKDAAMGAAKNAWDAAKGFFGADSPATKGIWLGRMFDLGIAKGINDAAYLPAETAARMAARTINNTRQQTNMFNMEVHTRAETATVQRDFNTMMARVPSNV